MKRKYFRLDLDGSEFWQEESESKFVKKPYEKKDFDYLNYVYFNQINNNTFEERLTGTKLILDKDKLLFPLGINVDLSKFTPCSRKEVLESFNALRHNNLNREYYKTLEDLLINSEYCEMFLSEDIIKK